MGSYNIIDDLHRLSTDHNTNNKTAYIEDQLVITFGDLFKNSLGVGYSLNQLNIKAGDRVILDLPDSIKFVEYLLGMISAGIIPVIVNNFFSDNELQHIIKVSSPSLIISNTPSKYKIFNIIHKSCIDIVVRPTTYFENNTTPDSDAFWICTSGTTGKPKIVVHKQKSILMTGKNFADVINLTSDDVVFSAAKMSHAYGLGNSIFIPLSKNATTIIMKDLPTPQKINDAINTHNVSTFFGIPRHYTSILSTKNLTPLSSSLNKCISAGESLPQSLWNKWHNKFGLKITNAVGSTESLGFVLYSNDYPNLLTPLSGVDVKINGDAEGEMLARAEFIAEKYSDGTSILKNKWLHTNDVYKISNSKFQYIGRTTDTIKINGLYVSIQEIESKFQQIEGVEDIAVLQSKNKYGLAKLVIQIVLSDVISNDFTKKIISKTARQQSLLFRRPYTIKFVGSIPKTASGKTKRLIS